MASPSLLDDPFDCRLPILFELYSEREIENLYRKHLRRALGLNSSAAKIERITQNLIAHGSWKDPRHLNAVRELNTRYVEQNYGIFSCSESATCIRLWEEYAGNHTGFCVGYDTYELENVCRQLHALDGVRIYLDRVEYSDIEGIDPRIYRDEQTVLKMLTTKKTPWSYQAESRLILYTETNKAIILPNNVLREVVLGARMSKKDRADILSVIRARSDHLIVWQATLTKDQERLQVTRIEV